MTNHSPALPKVPASHLTIPQAARMLGVTDGAVRALVRRGRLPSVAVFGTVMVPTASVRAFGTESQRHQKAIARRDAAAMPTA